MVSRRHGASRWTESELHSFKNSVKQFIKSMKDTLEKYHPSGLRNLKFHFLAHIHEDIERFGNVQMLCADHYENRHLIFKQQYERTSKRRSTHVRETVAKVGDRSDLAAENRCKEAENVKEVNNISVRHRGLVKIGVAVKLSEFRELLDFVKQKLVLVDSFNPKSCLTDSHERYHSDLIELFTQTCDQGGEPLLNFLKEEGIRKCGQYFEFSTRITMAKSGTLLGGHYCSVDNMDNAGKIVPLQRDDIFLQRVFGCQCYGNSKYGKYCFVLLEGSTDEGSFFYRIGQVRALFLIKWEGDEEDTEYAFVKYMEIAERMDSINDVHGCVCLRWSTDGEIDHNNATFKNKGEIRQSPWFGLENFKESKGVVHVVRQNYPIKPFGNDMHWPKYKYCLNCFQVVEKMVDIYNNHDG